MSLLAKGLLMLLIVSGCGGSDDDVTGRLVRLEGRLAALEQQVDALATIGDLEEQTVRLDRHLAGEPRQASPSRVPAKPAPLVPTFPPGVGAGVGGFPDVSQRERLNQLSAEYREGLSAIQRRYANDPTAPQRLREISELRSWFYDELRKAQAEAGAPPAADAAE